MGVELDSSFTVAVENYIQFDIPLNDYPPSETFLECQSSAEYSVELMTYS
jgi:hypothetical protein